MSGTQAIQTVNLRPLKRFALEKLPKEWPFNTLKSNHEIWNWFDNKPELATLSPGRRTELATETIQHLIEKAIIEYSSSEDSESGDPTARYARLAG